MTLVMEPLEGYQVEAEAGRAVALSLELDDELIREGLAREIVRAVQNARKEAGLEISDRIELRLGGDEELLEAAREHEDYVTGETLATSVAYDGDDGGRRRRTRSTAASCGSRSRAPAEAEPSRQRISDGVGGDAKAGCSQPGIFLLALVLGVWKYGMAASPRDPYVDIAHRAALLFVRDPVDRRCPTQRLERGGRRSPPSPFLPPRSRVHLARGNGTENQIRDDAPPRNPQLHVGPDRVRDAGFSGARRLRSEQSELGREPGIPREGRT